MRRFVILPVALLVAIMAFQGCASGAGDEATLHDAGGGDVGTVSVAASTTTSGVAIELDLKGLPPGEHAVHLHEVARCDGPSFESAGAHLNLAGRQHGLENPLGSHTGDLNNITVGPDGTAKATLLNPQVTLGSGAGSLGAIGASLVIHAQPDDMRTDPAGNSGDRIACAVIASR